MTESELDLIWKIVSAKIKDGQSDSFEEISARSVKKSDINCTFEEGKGISLTLKRAVKELLRARIAEESSNATVKMPEYVRNFS